MRIGELTAISGASQTGKTTWIMAQMKKHRRVIAWDPEDQFSQLPGFQRITSRAELLKAVQKKGPAKLAFVVGGNLAESFNFWAGCAFYWGRYVGPCAVVGEELADVSKTGKAPDKWGVLLRRGLKRGIDIYALSQRWAEADKTTVGNASRFVIFRSNGDDITYLAKKSRIPEDQIAALRDHHYIERDMRTGKINPARKLPKPRKR